MIVNYTILIVCIKDVIFECFLLSISSINEEISLKHPLLFNKTYSDEDIIDKFEHITKKDIVKIAQQIFSSKPTTAMIGKVKKIEETVNFI